MTLQEARRIIRRYDFDAGWYHHYRAVWTRMCPGMDAVTREFLDRLVEAAEKDEAA